MQNDLNLKQVLKTEGAGKTLDLERVRGFGVISRLRGRISVMDSGFTSNKVKFSIFKGLNPERQNEFGFQQALEQWPSNLQIRGRGCLYGHKLTSAGAKAFQHQQPRPHCRINKVNLNKANPSSQERPIANSHRLNTRTSSPLSQKQTQHARRHVSISFRSPTSSEPWL